MSCCVCNTIARALALTAIGTAFAFVDWANRPFASSLEAPKPIVSAGPSSAPTTGQTTLPEPAQGEDVHPPATGDAKQTHPDNDEPVTSVGDASAAGSDSSFDPNTLGTKITTADTYQLWQSGMVTFIDARPEHEYIEGHIPYAFCIPPESNVAQRLGDLMEQTGLSPADRVVIYCEGGSCNASELVGLTMQDMGFATIHIDADGYPGWVKAGYEIETGQDPVLGAVDE